MLTASGHEFKNDLDLLAFLASQTVDDDVGLPTWAQTLDPALLDPRHVGVRAHPTLLARSLEARYREPFFRDAIQTGHIEVINGRPFYRSRLGVSQSPTVAHPRM